MRLSLPIALAARRSSHTFSPAMHRLSALACSLFLAALPAAAQNLDTWVTSQGAMFEATIKQLVPGQAVFILKDGREQPVPLSDLSERSRTKLIEALGLGSTPVTPAATPATAAAPATPAPAAAAAAPAMTAAVTPATPIPAPDAAAIDATDATQIASRIGQQAAVVGIVSEVVTLGSSGHMLLKFDGSNFSVFIPRQSLQRSTDWILDDLPGKRVQMTGKLETYRDAPQIRGENPSQLVRIAQ